jgi:hydroxyacylglutathione hydrolase
MLLDQRFVPRLAIASYVVGDEKTGESAAIDPTRDVVDYLRYAEATRGAR